MHTKRCGICYLACIGVPRLKFHDSRSKFLNGHLPDFNCLRSVVSHSASNVLLRTRGGMRNEVLSLN